jgi:hypothetical protein
MKRKYTGSGTNNGYNTYSITGIYDNVFKGTAREKRTLEHTIRPLKPNGYYIYYPL